jgi:hypothetical protein
MRADTTIPRSSYLIAFLVLFLIVAIPSMLWSFSSNPPLAKTGAPGEGTCAQCHGGGAGGGKIAVTSSAGTHYHPGVKQHLKVTVTDASSNVWGYEMTSVQASKPTTGTGVFKATDKLSDVRKLGTKSYAAQLNDQQGKTKHVTFAIDWTPPSKNVGKITLYLAGVAGNNGNDSVYTSRLTLSPK